MKDHARLKEHVWSMSGRLDAPIYEGGMWKIPLFLRSVEEMLR